MKQTKPSNRFGVYSVGGGVGSLSREKLASRRRDAPVVLIIDDDLHSCQIAKRALTNAGYRVGRAATGTEGIAVARTRAFDFVLVDLQLPDMLGTEVVRVLRANIDHLRFALVGGFLTIRTAVEAMKLGAVDVVEKPLTTDVLLALVRAALKELPGALASTPSTAKAVLPISFSARQPRLKRPRSAAERWAMHVLKGCESEGDLKTLEDWAAYVGVSYSTLRESCRLLGIQPHDARDLMRLLRAVMRASHDCCHPAMLLDVADGRTMKNLLQRAALADGVQAGSVSIGRFFRTQKFVAGDNEALSLLQAFLCCQGEGA